MRTTRSSASRPSARRGRLALASLVAVAALVTGCSAGGSSEGADRPAKTSSEQSPTTGRSAPAEDAARPAQVVRTDRDLTAYAEPDAASEAMTIGATTELGSETALLITGAQGTWVEVLVPGRPTGRTAWLPAAGLEVRAVTTLIEVDLEARTLTLKDGGREVLSTPVAIGADETPTPAGRFSITDKLDTQDPDGAYGRYAIGLSGRSEVLTEFGGGDGQIGIHGTNEPGSIGQAVSHGCIRVPNDVMDRLNEILPLGTPVVVG
jgi:lipoprotein-anchoring transpeptidase ErfK/SrfK